MHLKRAVVAAEDVIKEASTYYDQKNYKDDKFAKGKELHPRLLAAFEVVNAQFQRLFTTCSAAARPSCN